MKHLKMLGLAAVAAMALMAFLGASSASATVLCKKNLTSGCHAAGEAYPEGTEIVSSLTGAEKAKLEIGSTILDECANGSVSGKTETTGSSTQTILGKVTAENLKWENCTRTTKTLAGGELEIHYISGTDNGTLTVRGFEVTVATIFGSCIYGFTAAAGDLGEVKGGEPATMAIKANVPKISGPCPGTEALWTANYTVTKPSPVFVSTD
jgi:hypothetical protein